MKQEYKVIAVDVDQLDLYEEMEEMDPQDDAVILARCHEFNGIDTVAEVKIEFNDGRIEYYTSSLIFHDSGWVDSNSPLGVDYVFEQDTMLHELIQQDIKYKNV